MNRLELRRAARWATRLKVRRDKLRRPELTVEGTLRRMVGLTLEADGCEAPVGSRCLVRNHDGSEVEAEVVGFGGERLYLMPTADLHGLTPNARVIPKGRDSEAKVGPALLGRVLDGSGRPLDGRGPIDADDRVPLVGRAINPLDRAPIKEPLDVGVRAINALFTVGRGQRMGLFAGSGVGKSVLLGMMTRYTTADVVVVGLIGERGREVKEFIENILGDEGRQRSVVVAAPADNSPLMRLHGAMLATSIAEYFRDQGLQVLLLMDSLTRYAQAQREIGLAIGEPPTTKGYPPSVFAKLPHLVERAGNGKDGGGSITAFYTVLAEGDDQNDPVADAARAILDGHLVLSRRLADAGHYPAIDIEASVSRAMLNITDSDQRKAVQHFKQLYSLFQQNEDLINVGAYQRGSDARIDAAINAYPRLMEFLKQDFDASQDFASSREALMRLLFPPNTEQQ
ncbi:flagellar protein export ATPase FliI [Alkalilimnicola ehrlichii]|uniref:Flagellum-specific ATP synthase n=1 Tax=Alkalilimnicola ehrlichii TaxID=351052 RepID=A0A3E0WRU7_9GAMM|nr:flagellar protein export ATPase FliI [Alkalilimnicola ehrlichii]RFA28542.1 flagellar protein export ATPase FliI [Alkalilimnicola ehrlichii]RFA35704.1 flagellar protein export ATPase FliI [Alkalilimnicola ehrlichii]